MEPILEVKHLSKSYYASDFKLEDVSFSIPYGSMMGFVGENGSGKSTVIRTILNTLKADNGTVRIFGNELSDRDTRIRQDIGVVFDAPTFSGALKAASLSNIMKQIYHNWDGKKFDALLTRFQLPDDQRFHTFSKGMLMKLSIAVALSHHPRLLILDEATNGLDPAARDDLSELFLEFLEDEGHSILFSTHITDELDKIADYITFLHHGKVLLTASKDELLYRYGVLRTRKNMFSDIDKADYLRFRERDFQTDFLITDKEQCAHKYPNTVIDTAFIDEIMLLLIKGESK